MEIVQKQEWKERCYTTKLFNTKTSLKNTLVQKWTWVYLPILPPSVRNTITNVPALTCGHSPKHPGKLL